MRTQDQIVARIQKKSKEFLNFEPEVLYDYLDYDHAVQISGQTTPLTRAEFDAQKRCAGGDAPTHERMLTEADISEQMAGYMSFAWGKVSGHRGISAGQSVQKMAALAWLLGDDDATEFAEDENNYAQYGAPILKYFCEKYALPVPDEEGLRRMAEGRPCEDGCDMGCGS